jgi:hypothetical protein
MPGHSHNKCIPPNLPSNLNIISKLVHSHPNQNVIIIGLKFYTNEADHLKMKLKQRPNIAKKVDTGSTNPPLPIAAQLSKREK